jgi:hypothetical protein
MHLYVAARGQYAQLNQWVADLSAKYFPFEHEPGQMGMAQLGVRPIQLFEIAFPENALDTVLRIVRPNARRNENLAYLLRKCLKLDEIPQAMGPPLDVANGGILAPFVSVEGIGVKKDRWQCHKCKKMFEAKGICCDQVTIEFI